jgi:hypothetical protein
MCKFSNISCYSSRHSPRHFDLKDLLRSKETTICPSHLFTHDKGTWLYQLLVF